MKHQKRSRRQQKKVRFWTRERALTAVPYVTSVVQSLREHKLGMQSARLRARRASEQPGKPTRETIIALEEAQKEAHQAKMQYEEALRELQVLNLKCTDPVRGEVLFPFVHDNLLAWLVFELFEDEPLTHWRYRDDPDDCRRPLEDLEKQASELSPNREKPKKPR